MDKKFFMFERSEFEKFPISSAFYSTPGRHSFASFSGDRKAEKGLTNQKKKRCQGPCRAQAEGLKPLLAFDAIFSQ